MFLELFKRLDIEAHTPRHKIEIMEWYMKNYVAGASDCSNMDYEHIFDNGWYIRKMFIPAGNIVVGMVHKTRHMNYILEGEALVMSDDFMLRSKSYHAFESQKETKKMVYAYNDVVYATTHKTNKTDIEEIKKDVVYDSDLSWIKAA